MKPHLILHMDPNHVHEVVMQSRVCCVCPICAWYVYPFSVLSARSARRMSACPLLLTRSISSRASLFPFACTPTQPQSKCLMPAAIRHELLKQPTVSPTEEPGGQRGDDPGRERNTHADPGKEGEDGDEREIDTGEVMVIKGENVQVTHEDTKMRYVEREKVAEKKEEGEDEILTAAIVIQKIIRGIWYVCVCVRERVCVCVHV
jgi:hypothetical protein